MRVFIHSYDLCQSLYNAKNSSCYLLKNLRWETLVLKYVCNVPYKILSLFVCFFLFCFFVFFSSTIWRIWGQRFSNPWVWSAVSASGTYEGDSGPHQLLLSRCHSFQVKPVCESSLGFFFLLNSLATHSHSVNFKLGWSESFFFF